MFSVVGGAPAAAPPATANWDLAARLLPAMVRQSELEIDGPVCERLLSGASFLQGVFSRWLGVPPVPLRCQRIQTQSLSPRTSAFFSGGVDSWFTLLVHNEAIDNLIFVHGFDIPLSQSDLFEKARALAEQAAGDHQKELIVLRTDLREAITEPSWSFLHGAALASAAHFLEKAHSRVLLASTHPYEWTHPWGSHPLTDPRWSSGSVEIVHTDAGESRLGKLRFLSQHPDVVRQLRVCWESDQINCGFCEKCMRTRLGLLATGGDAGAFPGTLTPRHVRRLHLAASSTGFWSELLQADLPIPFRQAVREVLQNQVLQLPPADGTVRGRARRTWHALRWVARYLGASVR